MRKRRILALALALALTGGTHAQAEELILSGHIVAKEAQRITAPVGGTLEALDVRVGEFVRAGETLAQIASEKVFSPMDGTVRGVSAQCGDSAEKTIFSIAPVSRFTISASIDKAYESVDTKYVVLGERLYIRCAKDGTHRAEGVVVAVNGKDFTVETDKGALYMEEKVYLYRSRAYADAACVGYGAVSRPDAKAIRGEGSLLALHVEEGETVERGQLLFETVGGTFAAGQVTDCAVRAGQDGVIAELCVQSGQRVAQHETIAMLYAPADFRVSIALDEQQARAIAPGDQAIVTLAAEIENGARYAGTVESVSFVQEDAAYSALIAFDGAQALRLGMTATVVITPGAV